MNVFKKMLVSAMLFVASFGAYATDYNLSVSNVGLTSFGENFVSGSFLDKINFTLSGSSSGSFGVGALNFTVGSMPILNINSLTMSLFDSNSNKLGYGSDFTVNTLGTGNYYLQITGLSNGVNGGLYGGGINMSPVPEPGIWSLLVYGLSIFCFMAYRRREMNPSH